MSISESELLSLAASVQQGSEHPLARAVVDRAVEESVTLAEPLRVRALPGRGVSATVHGRELLLGSSRLMNERGIDRTALEVKAAQLQAQGWTISWLAQLNGSRGYLGCSPSATR